MTDSKRFKISFINWTGERTPFASLLIQSNGGEIYPRLKDKSPAALIEKLSEGFLVVESLVNPDDLQQLLGEARSFALSEPSGYSETQSCWRFIERWVHIRKPQVRSVITVHEGEQRFKQSAKMGRFLVRLRNYLHGWDMELGIDPSLRQRADITYSHYPAGGGFMIEHRDTADEGTVCVLSLTEKGVDYRQGGLFGRSDEGQFLDMDAFLKAGDIVMMNAELRHGVENVDPMLALDAKALERGRWMLFAPMQSYSNRDYVLVE